MEPSTDDTYRVYLLRLWRERPASPGRPAVWRFSLEDTRTGQRRGFGDLQALVAFLGAQMEAALHAQSEGAETAGPSPS